MECPFKSWLNSKIKPNTLMGSILFGPFPKHFTLNCIKGYTKKIQHELPNKISFYFFKYFMHAYVEYGLYAFWLLGNDLKKEI